MRAVLRGNELARVEEEEPAEDGRGGKDELARERDEDEGSVGRDEEQLEPDRVRHHSEREDGELWEQSEVSVCLTRASCFSPASFSYSARTVSFSRP